MRLLSNILIILALAMMVGAGLNILTKSLEWVITFLFGLILFWAALNMRPKRKASSPKFYQEWTAEGLVNFGRSKPIKNKQEGLNTTTDY